MERYVLFAQGQVRLAQIGDFVDLRQRPRDCRFGHGRPDPLARKSEEFGPKLPYLFRLFDHHCHFLASMDSCPAVSAYLGAFKEDNVHHLAQVSVTYGC